MGRTFRLILVLAFAGAAAWLLAERPWKPQGRTVVLISIDTCRPERLGLYGGGSDVSPRIDALAREAVVFDQALAPAPWTLPSHMSMLTGLDPIAHGVRNADNKLSTRITTLAEALRSAGFRTAGFTDGGFVKSLWGFGQGFEVYRDQVAPDGPNGFRRLLPEALDWIRRTRSEDRFIFLHTFDVHAPYQEGDPEVLERFRRRPAQLAPGDWQLDHVAFLQQQRKLRVAEYDRMQALLNDYDAGVHEADRGVGAVLDLLAEQGALASALVIVTSDHGESFADHGLHVGHGIGLTDDELRIPLVVRFPGREGAGSRLRTLVDLVDVAPTVLHVLGLPIPEEMQGESLLALARGEPRSRGHCLAYSQNTRSLALVEDGYKLIGPPMIPPLVIAKNHLGPMNPPSLIADRGEDYEFGRGDERVTLRYDTEHDPLGLRDLIPDSLRLYRRDGSDPHERNDVSASEPEVARRMSQDLLDRLGRSTRLFERLDDGSSDKAKADQETQKHLAQLGYTLAGGAGPEAEALLAGLPPALREPLKDPWRAPDDSLLVEADAGMHFLRVHAAEGRLEGAAARDALLAAGDLVAHWAAENVAGPHAKAFAARAVWRIEAILALGEQLGVAIDKSRWRRVLLEARESSPR